jgi:hypothetical protein
MITVFIFEAYKGVYTHKNSFVHCYNFFFIITCSFSVFVENCILLPNGIQNVFVVFLGIVHLWLKKSNSNNKFMFVINNPKGTHL